MENDYEVEEVPISKGLETLKSLTNDTIRTIPQVTIDGEYIGGFAEVEAKIKPQDLSGLLKSIQEVREQVAGLKIPNVKPIEAALKELEEYGWELEEDIEELSKDVAIVKKENELQDIQIEEIKTKANNPLAN